MATGIIAAMAATAGIESVLLWILGYRQKIVWVWFIVLNLVSNCIANILYQHIWSIVPQAVLVSILEIGVVAFEFIGLGLVVPYTRRLFWVICVTNLISFVLGALIVGI